MFAHRCAAVAVRGALRRWRLHHNVGHVTGVISALFNHLKRWEVELNGVQQSWLYVDLLFLWFLQTTFFLCISSVSASSKAVLGGPVPCHSLAGTWTGSDWGAAWHHAGDQSYGNEGRHCSAPPCSGCRRRRRAGCSSWSFRGGMCRWAVEGGTNKERRKCWFTACKTGSSGTIVCAERTAEHLTFCCSVEVQKEDKSTP